MVDPCNAFNSGGPPSTIDYNLCDTKDAPHGINIEALSDTSQKHSRDKTFEVFAVGLKPRCFTTHMAALS